MILIKIIIIIKHPPQTSCAIFELLCDNDVNNVPGFNHGMNCKLVLFVL